MPSETTAVQSDVLQKYSAEAEVILRISGIGNAVTAVARSFSARDDSPAGLRDQSCLWILVGSYLNEAVRILNKRHDGLAWKLAEIGVANGITLPPATPLAHLKQLLNKDSDFIKTCNLIRDKFAFHIDREPMMEWLKDRPHNEGVGIISQLGPTHEDIVFDAAAFAVFDATDKLLVNDFDTNINSVVLALPYLVEAMVRGLVVSRGLVITLTNVDGNRVALAHEPPITSRG